MTVVCLPIEATRSPKLGAELTGVLSHRADGAVDRGSFEVYRNLSGFRRQLSTLEVDLPESVRGFRTTGFDLRRYLVV